MAQTTTCNPPKPLPAMAYHTPVLLAESVDALHIRRGGVYIDATFGGGGHAREILKRLEASGGGHLYAFDHDSDAAANIPQSSLFTFVQSNFRWLANWMRYYKINRIDGLIADLGVSAHHFDDPARGFSLRFDSSLDMRMNRAATRTAADIIREDSEEELANIFYHYGELRNARQLAAKIVLARGLKPIATTGALLDVVNPLLPPARRKKEQAKIFQALRIEVNGELTALKQMLEAAISLLCPGGRMAIITYHSLEDRIVKNVFRNAVSSNSSSNSTSTSNAANGSLNEGDTNYDVIFGTRRASLIVATKIITPSPEEQSRNPRSRSAKLRVAEKI
ncbi:MAG: 16S rRNA (cytosine(1402)-N(4))-methyltransferase RsmH [Prevotella sp.]|nr:16S rRNA (cytosine(1402)-N(4))-methyltransferase RsmH [Prevotella sp.]